MSDGGVESRSKLVYRYRQQATYRENNSRCFAKRTLTQLTVHICIFERSRFIKRSPVLCLLFSLMSIMTGPTDVSGLSKNECACPETRRYSQGKFFFNFANILFWF